MKEIQLTGKIGKGKVCLVDDEDFEKVSKYKWHMSTKGYVLRQVWIKELKKTTSLVIHHFIMGKPEGKLQLDHINGNKLDNRKSNLRLATNSLNQANQGLRSNNSSGYKGVHYNTGHKKWCAMITKNNKRTVLGYFTNPQDASNAYNVKAKELFGEFSFIGF